MSESVSISPDGESFPLPTPLADIDAYVVYVGFDPQSLNTKPERKPAPA